MPKPWENKSGLPDPTAYQAINDLSAEDDRVTVLVHTFKAIAKLAGFRITNRIEFQNIHSGRIHR